MAGTMAAAVCHEQKMTLIARARIRDKAAIGQLLRQCNPDLRQYARMHCRLSDIDDAVQESMLTLSRKAWLA